MNIPLASNYIDVGAHVHQSGDRVNQYTVSQLAAGSGIATEIENGKSVIIVKDEEPVAIYRPYDTEDQGERINATTLYTNVRKFVERVEKGKSVIVTRRGDPFATLCKYEEPKPKATKPVRRRVLDVATDEAAEGTTAKADAQGAAATSTVAESPANDASILDAIQILQAVYIIPEASRIKFLELGATLSEQGQLARGIALLKVLMD